MHLPFKNTIKLNGMDQVKLMNRIDTKFWFHVDMLPEILEMVKDEYLVLEINDRLELAYSTVYYDTGNDCMYIAHHNGKLNRYKVRLRTYVESGMNFLEIKKKNNKGRTIKNRIRSSINPLLFENTEKDFVNLNCPYECDDLSPVLRNEFTRITLVNKNLNERCTIDLNLRFKTENEDVLLDKLVIIEIKSDGLPSASPLRKALQKVRVKKSGFSKYCVGRVLTNPLLKSNAFKPRIRKIEKSFFSDN